MAFKAKLAIDGKEFDVLRCSYHLRRDVDAKGRPSSNIYGGRIEVTIESTEDTSIIESMVNQFKPCTGSVIFNKGNEDSKMKELMWENGYIIEFKEDIDVIGKQPMLLSFCISAQILKIGGAQVEQDWPTGN